MGYELRWRQATLTLALLGIELAAGLSLICPMASADDGASLPQADGKLAGAFAGLLLFALVAYALWLYASPLIRKRDRGFAAALAILLGLWIVKTVAQAFCPGFGNDVGTYEAWALSITNDGPAQMYRAGFFLDYPPGYLYALWAAGWIARTVGATDGLRLIVDMPALAADFALAAMVFVMVRRAGGRRIAWVAMLMVALNPALLFDTVVWNQTDSALGLALLLSVAMMIEGEFELGWALAGLALIVKPQAITLIPVLGLWTVLKWDFRKWWRAILAFVAVVVIAAAPFSTGLPWNWLPQLYLSTAAFYHETSVNAFNLMALLGGLRQDDAGLSPFGISYFAIGLWLLAPLYAFVAWMLSRKPTPQTLLLAVFIALFGFFMVAPRMHERYLYPAVVFAVPLALAEPWMMAAFALVTLTGTINLWYVLRALNNGVFLDPRDGLAIAVALVNCVVLAIAIYRGYTQARVPVGEVLPAPSAGESDVAFSGAVAESMIAAIGARVRAILQPGPAAAADLAVMPWRMVDTIALAAIVAVAAGLRFWHLWHPPEIVFDEVHFVGQARHYIRGESFIDPHPPIAKLIIAAGILAFGDHSSSWRLGVATMGTLLVAITYLLARRMFHSTLAAVFAAALVALDGFFLVDSRIACIDIIYLTFAALSYLLLFRLMQTPDPLRSRPTLAALGITLGLCLGSKLYVPGVTFLLVMGFLWFTLMRPSQDGARPDTAHKWRVGGALTMVSALAAFFYIASFIPHYTLGWWGGISDLFHYYGDVVNYENSVSTATHPYASPWWSWPLMLRPVAYWQNFPARGGPVATIWGAGNPVTWWTVIPAMTVTMVRAIERPSVTRSFMVIGFLAYYLMWIPIGRILFLYHYMPSIYIGYLALGGLLADLWAARAELWESLSLLTALCAAIFVGFYQYAAVYNLISAPIWAGIPVIVVLGIGFGTLIKRPAAHRYVAAVFIAGTVIAFVYFAPVWLGIPIARKGYYARMWLEGPGLRNWI